MMSKTGNNLSYGVRSAEYGALRRGTRYLVHGTRKGFTLVEVMVATAVLALGVVLIHESFISSLNSFSYYSHYLNVASWMNEKIWEAQNSITRLGTQAESGGEGELAAGGKAFRWDIHSELRDATRGLYEIRLAVSWLEGKRRPQLTRSAYAIYLPKE